MNPQPMLSVVSSYVQDYFYIWQRLSMIWHYKQCNPHYLRCEPTAYVECCDFVRARFFFYIWQRLSMIWHCKQCNPYYICQYCSTMSYLVSLSLCINEHFSPVPLAADHIHTKESAATSWSQVIIWWVHRRWEKSN